MSTWTASLRQWGLDIDLNLEVMTKEQSILYCTWNNHVVELLIIPFLFLDSVHISCLLLQGNQWLWRVIVGERLFFSALVPTHNWSSSTIRRSETSTEQVICIFVQVHLEKSTLHLPVNVFSHIFRTTLISAVSWFSLFDWKEPVSCCEIKGGGWYSVVKRRWGLMLKSGLDMDAFSVCRICLCLFCWLIS